MEFCGEKAESVDIDDSMEVSLFFKISFILLRGCSTIT